MTTAEKDNIKQVLSSIDSFASRGNTSRQRAFAAWYAHSFLGADEDEALDLACMDGGEDQGIDLVFADTATSQIYILQAHCPDPGKPTPISKWDAVTASIAPFESPDIFKTQGRKELYEHITSIKQDYPGYEIIFGLITLGAKSNQITKKIDTVRQSKTFSQYKFFYEPLPDVLSKYVSLVASERSIAADSINFKGGYLKNKGKFGEAWFGTVAASELIRLYTTYSNDLFAGNVRLFIGARKGSINEQTIKTARDEPGLFWALNNGISIVAKSVENDDKDENKLLLHRFSIVNGCQTTSCLAAAKADSADVLVRIVAAKPSVVSDIVRFNNSQNAVKIWAVRSVDDTQENLRSEFSKHGIQYAPKREGSKNKRDPHKIIELDKVTQFLASAHNEFLIQAINGKTELFDQPYLKLFGHGIKASQVYLSWRLGVLCDELRQGRASKLKADADRTSNALLGVSGTYWIIYCANKLVLAANPNIGAQLEDLGRQKSLEFDGALKKYGVAALDMYFDTAIDTYDDQEFGSVRSALRSPRFLQKFDQKLTNKLASKLRGLKLPSLGAALKSANKNS